MQWSLESISIQRRFNHCITMAARYHAFISYSHSDARIAAWLHRALETYAVPKGLAGSQGRHGAVPARLFPIFRDREELATATDLPARIEEALAQSPALIVVCSPAAAQSRWVGQEIQRFIELHGRERVLCLIASGEPHAGDARECFPAPVRVQTGAQGETLALEPIAADARPQGDGRDGALLKLLAGLLGVDLDRLRQRDLQRRRRRNRLWAVAALLVISVLAGAAWYANLRRIDAVGARDAEAVQRERAERAAVAETVARGDERQARLLAEEREREASRARDAETVQRQRAEDRERDARAARDAETRQRQRAQQQQAIAEEQRDLADRRRQVALARQLAAQSERVRVEQPGEFNLAALLAVEAARRLDTLETQQALQAVRQLLPPSPRVIDTGFSMAKGQFSADGKFVVVQGPRRIVVQPTDGAAPSWQAAESSTTEWTLTPDGCCLLTWNDRDGWRLRAITDGRDVEPAPPYLAALRGVRVPIRHTLKFSATGNWLSASGTMVRIPEGTAIAGAARAGDFSADGRWLAQSDGKRLNLRSQDGAAPVELATSLEGAPVLSADGALVAVLGNERFEVMDVKAKQRLYGRACPGPMIRTVFSPDGSRLALACGNEVQLLDARSGTVAATLLHDRPIGSVRFDARGRLLLTGSYDRTARIWDVARGRELWRATHEGYVTEAYFSPDGKSVLTAGIDAIQVWPLDLGETVVAEFPRPLSALGVSPDGRTLAAATFEPDARLFLVNAATGAVRAAQSLASRFVALAFDAKGERALMTDGTTLRVVNVAEPSSVVWEWQVPNSAYEKILDAAFAPTGEVLLALGSDRIMQGHITLLRCTPGADCVTRREPTSAFGNRQAFFASDASQMVFSLVRDSVSEFRAWPTASVNTHAVQVLPAMRVNALVARDNLFYVAHTAGRLVERFAQPGPASLRFTHEGYVHHLALSRDGRHLAAALSDPVSTEKNRVVVWRTDSAAEIARFVRPRQDGPVQFSPDGQRLYYVDGNTLRAVTWQAGAAIESACSRLRRNLTCEEWRQWVGDEPYRATCAAIKPGCDAK